MGKGGSLTKKWESLLKTLVSECFCLGFLTVTLSLGSCSSDSELESSLEHNYGSISRDVPSYTWYKLETKDEEEIYRKFISKGFDQNFYLLPDDSSVALRLNYWVDFIDSTLRSKYPDQLKNIPVPKAWISDSNISNAFVSMMPMCFSVPIVKDLDKYKSSKLSSPVSDIFSVLFSSIHSEKIGIISASDCLPSKTSDEQTISSVVDQIVQLYPECKLSLESDEGQTYIKVNDCDKINFKPVDEGGYSSFSITTIPNRIVFLAGMLEQLQDESYVVSVLAHELSHYYKAHVETISDELLADEYNYMYETSESNPDSKPKPSSDASITELGKKIKTMGYKKYDLTRIQGQKYRSELFDIMLHIAEHIKENQTCTKDEPGCNNECKDLVDWLKNPYNHLRWSAIYPKPMYMTETFKKQYFELENKFEACYSKLSIGDDPLELQNANQIRPSDFLCGLPLLNYFAGEDILSGVEFQGGVLDALANAEKLLIESYIRQDQLVEEAYNKNLGFYTKEQEADEMSVEILHLIGFNLKTAVHLYLTLSIAADEKIELYNTYPYPHAERLVSCLNLYNNGWKTPDGKPYFVNVGDYTDSHHSACYRAYNLDREIKAHPEYNTPIVTDKKKLLSESEYQDLLEEIAQFKFTHPNEIGSIILRL